MKLCLIEDNPNDVELTQIALRKAGLNIEMIVYRDGALAIEGLLASDSDLHHDLQMVLLDLKLPRINGFEVLQRLRSDARFDTIPVVILTSSAVESDIRKAYSLRANSYIVKPIDYIEHAKALTQSVRYWLETNTLPN